MCSGEIPNGPCVSAAEFKLHPQLGRPGSGGPEDPAAPCEEADYGFAPVLSPSSPAVAQFQAFYIKTGGPSWSSVEGCDGR